MYSKSIATEEGIIYLTGGYNPTKDYLKSCHRYDRETLVKVSDMN